MLVKIDDVRFHGTAPRGGAFRGFQIEPEGFSGWDGGVTIERDDVARAVGPGEYDSAGRYGARVVSLRGWCVAPSPAELEGYRRRLTRLSPDDEVRVWVDHLGLQTWAWGRITALEFDVDGATMRRARYQVRVRCADPARYGPDRTSTPITAMRAQVAHRGNAAALPWVDIASPSGFPLGYAVRLLAGGDTVGYLRITSLPAGRTHRIDMASGLVLENGTLRDDALHSGSPWSVPPWTVCEARIEPVGTSTGSLVVTTPDTYM